MSDVIKKCRKDGTEFGETFAGLCPVCGEAVAAYCRKHNEWLTGPTCPKCGPQPVAKAVVQQSRISADVVFVIGALGLVLALVVLIVFAARRYFVKPTKSAAAPVTAIVPVPKPTPAPTPPPAPVVLPAPTVAAKTEPTPAFPTYPPASVSLADILRDPDSYDGKMVSTTGSVQLIEAGKSTFDLRDGNRSLTVFYRYATPPSKANVVANSRVVVTGLLQRLDQEDAWQIVAQTIEQR